MTRKLGLACDAHQQLGRHRWPRVSFVRLEMHSGFADVTSMNASPKIPPSTAGASAQHKADRLRRSRDDRVRRKHKRLGGVILALTDEPQSTTAWSRGAEGERRLGAGLDRLAPKGVTVLHDRQRPRTRANIDHLAIAASGIWVIDAKLYKGRVERRAVGGWFSKDSRLFVAGRDRSNLLDGLDKQRAVVAAALQPIGMTAVPVYTALCFVDGDWPLLAKPFELRGHFISWPKALYSRISADGPLSDSRRLELTNALERALPPAG
jgi:hypothetical protein